MSAIIYTPYAILLTVKLAFCTNIAGAGVVAGVALSLVFSTLTLKQQPFGTLIIAVDVTLKKFSCVGGFSAVAAGVTIALLVNIGSPSIAKATLMPAGAVPPSGIAILPLNVT
jgi:hypothetical protein